ATFTGQARVSARNFAQSVNDPQTDELMDFALSQLIMDTVDVRSAIRGHSLARDMYGNDANTNGYLDSRPGGPGQFPYDYTQLFITGVTPAGGTSYNLATNIPQSDPAFYGYSFIRWIIRVTYLGSGTGTGAVDQTLEVTGDNGFNATSTTA